MADAPANGDNNGGSGNGSDYYPLSAAFLAPLNSIFEAQVHAARSFLNFLLKMGFRHQYTPQDITLIESRVKDIQTQIDALGNGKSNADAVQKLTEQRDELQGIIDEEKNRQDKKTRMRQLFKKRKEQNTLTDQEIVELKTLNAETGELYQQSFDMIDDTGNGVTVNIPNLALLPVKPLSIQEADISFEFNVEKSEAWKTKDDEDRSRPWFLIKEPKSLRGEIATTKAGRSESSIKVNMKIEASEMPSGLERMLVHLTNSIESVDTDDLPDKNPSSGAATSPETPTE